MLLQGKSPLFFAVMLSAMVLFNACGRFAGEPKKEVKKEIQSISRVLGSKKITELHNELDQVKTGLQESNVNLTMSEDSITRLNLKVDNLKSEVEELKLRSEGTRGNSNIIDEIHLLKKEIRLVERDIRQLRKSKKRSDIKIWEME